MACQIVQSLSWQASTVAGTPGTLTLGSCLGRSSMKHVHDLVKASMAWNELAVLLNRPWNQQAHPHA